MGGWTVACRKWLPNLVGGVSGAETLHALNFDVNKAPENSCLNNFSPLSTITRQATDKFSTAKSADFEILHSRNALVTYRLKKE
jgi:hypothetical protein